MSVEHATLARANMNNMADSIVVDPSKSYYTKLDIEQIALYDYF